MSSQERNRPKEAPKAPEKAPFFIPSLVNKGNSHAASRTTATLAEFESITQHAEAEHSRLAKVPSEELHSSAQSITNHLKSGRCLGDFEPLIEHLKSLSPARTDLEIRSLDHRIHDGFSEMSTFVDALTTRLGLRRDFELVNAWMAVLLKVHADTVGLCSHRREPEYRLLRAALASWSSEQEREGKRLAGLVGYCRGVVSFLRSAR